MDATIMRSIPSLLPELKEAYPHLTFTPGEQFRWSPSSQTVFYEESSDNAPLLLHELGHGVLQHRKYTRDIELIGLEREAWDEALKLGLTHGVEIDRDGIEDHLDTYREWMHARSTCPQCTATGIQVDAQHYRCVACGNEWRVNEARICALRRYKK